MEQADGQTKYGVYVRSMLNRKVVLKITEIGKNIGTNLQKLIVSNTEGKCIPEGYIRPNSVKVMAYSSGKIKDDHVEFDVVYECLLCYPLVDMIVECTVTNVTHAGIHSHVKDKDSDNIPITVFIARDHNNTNKLFNSVKEGAKIEARIIGVRFELNDPSITAIAILLDKRGAGQERVYEVKKPLSKSLVEPEPEPEPEYVVEEPEYVVEEPVEEPLQEALQEKKVSENKLEPTPIKNKPEQPVSNYWPAPPEYWSAWPEENAAIEQRDLNKQWEKLRKEVEQGYKPATALHFTVFPGDPGWREEPAVVYNEEEIFKRPARKIIVRK